MTEKIIITNDFPYDKELHKRILGLHIDENGNEFLYRPEEHESFRAIIDKIKL